MPPREVYSVSFLDSNMTPVTSENWGPLVLGGSQNGTRWVTPSKRGLKLRMHRGPAEIDPVLNTIYVVLSPGALPIDSRFRMRAWFDTPSAQPLPDAASPPPTLENWAVGLTAKLGGAVDLPADIYFAVTCQFRRAQDVSGVTVSSGVRLNGVKELQADQNAYLDEPLDYKRYYAGCLGFGRAPKFLLEMNFCGVQSAPIPNGPEVEPPKLGHAVVGAALSIDGRSDQRVLSTNNLSTDTQSWIGALGVGLATLRGVGDYSARLQRFEIALLPALIE